MSMEELGEIGGRPVFRARLQDGDVAVHVLSYGAIVQDWRVRGADGVERSVTLGYGSIEPYAENRGSFGILAGRVANRVRNGRFQLGGTSVQLDRNHGAHHLHGGAEGLGRQHFDMEASGRSVRLTHSSPDGHMGYPGRVDFEVSMALSGYTLHFNIFGKPDRPTPIALAQHSYYRLGRPLAEHSFAVNAAYSTVLDDDKLPTGELHALDGTPLDFREPRLIGDTPIDNNFCLTGHSPAAALETDLYTLALETDRPGLQVFNGYDLPTLPATGHDGLVHGPFAGIALEAQDLPDTLNNPQFGDIIATPDEPYRQLTSVTISPAGR